MADSSMDAEQIAEAMLLQGAGIMREAIETYRPIAIFAAFSGGNDSIVSTHFACTNYSADVVNCNTKTGVQRTVEHMRATCARHGWKLHEKHAEPSGQPAYMYRGRKPDRVRVPFDPAVALPFGKWIEGSSAYEEYVFNFGFPGPAQHGRMFDRLKGRSLERLLAETKRGHHRRSHVLFVSGIRKDESARRAGYNRAIQKDGSAVWVNPFYYQNKYAFEVYRQEFGLRRNPVSDCIGISGECNDAAYAKPGEKEKLRSVDAGLVARIERTEEKVRAIGFPWGWGERPPKEFRGKPCEDLPGQLTLFDVKDFQPMCVGCEYRRLQPA